MYSVIVIPVLVGIVTQLIKLIIDGIPNNLNWQHLFNDYGGWPSSHTALVASLTLMVGLMTGFANAPFAIALVLLIIVVRDAMGFRREIGKNAVLTNMLAQEVFPANPEALLTEQIGHSQKEVLAGLIIGTVLTFLFYWLMLIV